MLYENDLVIALSYATLVPKDISSSLEYKENTLIEGII